MHRLVVVVLNIGILLLTWLLVSLAWGDDSDQSPQNNTPEQTGQVSDQQVWEQIRRIDENSTRAEIASLLSLDETLSTRDDAVSHNQRAALLRVLGESGNDIGVGYVRSVFESEPEWRDEAAVALSQFASMHRRRHDDWQFLVRSLMVVEGDQAKTVLTALRTFRERATKSVWIRQVILLGLSLDKDGARDAMLLLKHWSGTEPSVSDSKESAGLSDWQDWFRERFPQEPDPVLPVETDGSRWKYQELRQILKKTDWSQVDPAMGAKVFEKAGCAKCHRFGKQGHSFAPELTRVARRLQEKQILQSILFPSLYLNEEFQNMTLLLNDGRIVTGTVCTGTRETITVTEMGGKTHVIPKVEIEQTIPSKISGMPVGLMDNLTLKEIQALFAFLIPRLNQVGVR